MEKTLNLGTRILEYDGDSLKCASSKFRNARGFDWNTLLNNRETWAIDAGRFRSEEIGHILKRVRRNLTSLGFGEDERFRFYISLSEAIVNAQRHTFRYEQGRVVYLRLFFSPKLVLAGISSSGREYDVGKAVETVRVAGRDPMRKGGRGTYFMATNCDLFFASKSGKDSEVLLGILSN